MALCRKMWILFGAFFLGCVTRSLAYDFHQSFVVDKSTVSVHIQPEPPPVLVEDVMDWVKMSAKAVTEYYGQFPVPDVQITIDTSDKNKKIHHGVTYFGKRITIELGQETRAEDFAKDWELTHEMFHLGFPLLDGDYDWAGEGLSDYIEPIARAHLGNLSDEKVWKDMVEGFPKGLPEKGDEGLDNTHTWGRTYWGGAMYWFLADLEIRRHTHNQHSIRDALKAILDAGGNGREYWEIDRALSIGDKATNTTVLTDLHNQMGEKPYTPDLKTLWKQLGVQYDNGRITFDDTASDAVLRQSITQK